MTRAADADVAQRGQWELLTRVVGRTQQQVLARIEEIGVPAAWFGVLHELLSQPGHSLPMSRLARELSMTSGGFTKLADRMGQEGLIDRRASEGDRRVVFAALTDEGLRLARKAERVYQVALREYVFENVPAELLTTLADAVRPLAEVAVEVVPEAPVLATSRDPGLPERRTRFANRPN